MLPRHEQFIKEREYVNNVSPATIQWYEQSLCWLNTESPTTEDIRHLVMQLELSKYEVRIRSACSNLSHSSVRNLAPDSKAKIRLNSVLRTRWFHERVFDKFLWWNGT